MLKCLSHCSFFYSQGDGGSASAVFLGRSEPCGRISDGQRGSRRRCALRVTSPMAGAPLVCVSRSIGSSYFPMRKRETDYHVIFVVPWVVIRIHRAPRTSGSASTTKETRHSHDCDADIPKPESRSRRCRAWFRRLDERGDRLPDLTQR